MSSKQHLTILPSGEPSVRCHVHGESIRLDCQLSKCVFHTNYPNVKNCILVYMASHNVDSLKAIDISMLKGIPSSKVSRDLTKATNLMRNDTLKVSTQSELDAKFITLPGLGVCYSCEVPISSRNKKRVIETKTPRTKKKICYCSQECYDERPPQFIAAEMACKTDMKTVTEWAVAKYSTLGGLEQALGMNRALLGETLNKVMNVSAEELYSTTQRVKTRSKSLVRRTGSRPEWLSNFSELLAAVVDEMEETHGKSKVDFSHLLDDVQSLIDSL